MTMRNDEVLALDEKNFHPLMTHSSPSFMARVDDLPQAVVRRAELPSAPHQVERLDLLPDELVGPVELSLVLRVGLEVPRHRASSPAAAADCRLQFSRRITRYGNKSRGCFS